MPDFERMAGPVLCIAAHPEDIEIHAGGTVARLVGAGHEVAYVLCTSGNRGTGDPTLTPEVVAGIRQAEQRRAAAILGVQDITFLRHDDGDLQYAARALREQIVRLIRQKRPRTVITHDPFPGDGSHDSCAIYPDHLTVGRVVFEATLVCAPGPLFYPEHLREGPSTSSGHRLQPHKPEVLYLIMSQQPDTFVEISEVWETKMAAVHVYESQGRHLPGVEPFFRGVARQLGARAGVELAEGFRTLRPT